VDGGGWIGVVMREVLKDRRGKGGGERGNVSLMIVMFIITGGGRSRFLKVGVVVASEMFVIFVSGLLTPCINRSIDGDGSSGMNKGGGEFS
jgi:hypothetical protein